MHTHTHTRARTHEWLLLLGVSCFVYLGGLSVGGNGVQASVLFVGGLILAVRDRFADAFACAVFCVIRGDAKPLLPAPCSTLAYHVSYMILPHAVPVPPACPNSDL